MGRIRPSFLKRIGDKLVREHSELLTTSFEENKKVVEKLTNVTSKKLRNRIAGYVTKVMRRLERGAAKAAEEA